MEKKRPHITDIVGEELKTEFLQIYSEKIGGFQKGKLIGLVGSDKLLEWLLASDFFTAPASTMYHLSCKYGLLAHSINVYKRLRKSVEIEYGDKWQEVLGVDESDIALIGLLHDICKANTYTVEQRNVITGVDNMGKNIWGKEDFYKYNPSFEYGHGEKSVFIIQSFIQGLSLNTTLSIRYHMLSSGSPNSSQKDDNAMKMCEDFPIILFTGIADMQATFLDEKREDK